MGTNPSKARLKEKRAADTKLESRLREYHQSLWKLKPTPKSKLRIQAATQPLLFLNSDVLGDILSFVPRLPRDSLRVVSHQFNSVIVESCPPWPSKEEIISEWYDDSLWADSSKVVNRHPSSWKDTDEEESEMDNGGGSSDGSRGSSGKAKSEKKSNARRISRWEDKIHAEIFGRTVDQNCFIELVHKFNNLVVESWMSTGLAIDATVIPPLTAVRLKSLLLRRDEVLAALQRREEGAKEHATVPTANDAATSPRNHSKHETEEFLLYVEAQIRLIIIRASLEESKPGEMRKLMEPVEIKHHDDEDPYPPSHRLFPTLSNLGMMGKQLWTGVSFGADNQFFEGWAKTIRKTTVEDFWINGVNWDERGFNAVDREKEAKTAASSSSSSSSLSPQFKSRIVNERTYRFDRHIVNNHDPEITHHSLNQPTTYLSLRQRDGLGDMHCCFLYEALISTLEEPRFIFIYMTADDP